MKNNKLTQSEIIEKYKKESTGFQNLDKIFQIVVPDQAKRLLLTVCYLMDNISGNAAQLSMFLLKEISPINKGSKVQLVKLDDRKIDRLKVGQAGVVLAVRQLADDDGPLALVKFKGKSGPVSVYQNQLKIRK